MIWLAGDCLVFQLANGEAVPFSAEMISVEMLGGSVSAFDPEVIRNAAASVIHYFRTDLDRDSVTVGEFAEALEKVLRGLGFTVTPDESSVTAAPPAPNIAADLGMLARESGCGGELEFFPKLRDVLRGKLRASPEMVRFQGLRPCVKHLAGAQRWSARCESVQEQIVDYLRTCLSAERHHQPCSLVVE